MWEILSASLLQDKNTAGLKVIVVSEPADDHRSSRRWGVGQQLPSGMRLTGEAQLMKEKRYIFDRAFDGTADTKAVYSQSVRVRLLVFCFSLQHEQHLMLDLP